MYCGFIVTLNYLRPHPNADKLQIATVFNEDVVVDLSYSVGQKCVYFPSDGQLGVEFCEVNNLVRKKDENGNNVGGYLDPIKRNVKAIKLRGVTSDGLVLPVESLSTWCDVNKLENGQQITILNKVEICRKYIPKTNKVHRYHPQEKKKKSNTQITYPYFLEHVDTQQLRFNTDKFKVGDLCTITLKCHGTSNRISNNLEFITKKRNWVCSNILHMKPKKEKIWKMVSGTRRVVLQDFSKPAHYEDNLFRKKYHDYLADKLPKGMTIYSEIVGWINDDTTIMSRCNNSKISDPTFKQMYGDETIFSYGCNVGENSMYVYRITMTNEDGVDIELSWSDVQIWCAKLGLQPVPTFESFFFTTIEDLWERVYKYYDGPDPVGKTHIREGVVVRIENREHFTAYKHKNDNFKILEGIMKENSTVPDIEEEQEIIAKEDSLEEN